MKMTMKTALMAVAMAFAGTVATVAGTITELGNVPVDWTANEQNFGTLAGTPKTLKNALAEFNVEKQIFTFPKANELKKIHFIDLFEVEVDGVPVEFKKFGELLDHVWAAPKKKVRHADALDESGIIKTQTYVAENGLTLIWSISLRERSPYFTQTFELKNSGKNPQKITGLRFGKFSTKDVPAKAIGACAGSPVLLGNDILCGVESPNFQLALDEEKSLAALQLPVNIVLNPKVSVKFSSMIGYFPAEQRRRAFNYYVERERAAPSQHFLHYNCWYDYGLDPTESKMLASFEAYGKELRSRKIKLDSVVLDDGWDYPVTGPAWSPTPSKFPNGFKPLTKMAKKYHSNFGIWISPMGGYFDTEKRVEAIKADGGLDPAGTQLDLADPLYYRWFLKKCTSLVKDDGVNYFKWDKAGEGASMHFLKLCEIAAELRKINPKIFLNVTVGTWPSPFWLNHIDCTWRNGTGDVAWYNQDVGDKRDQWLTFRDQEAINCFSKKGPLYPLNSAMHHGIVLGTQYQGKDCAEAGTDLKREIRSYFGLGPNLQEIYVDYKMVAGTPFWDQLAESVKWAEKHAKTLVDVHWVKGEPVAKEAYAFAAWRAGDGVIYLRNSAAEMRKIELNLAEAFELPRREMKANYVVKCAYADDEAAGVFPQKTVPATENFVVELAPLQVLILDAEKIEKAKKSEKSEKK